MKFSESISELAKSLVVANKSVKNPQKNAVNPHFRNRYATLDAIIEAYKDSYLNNGISVLENPKTEDGKVGVEITLLHESGQFITHDPFMLPPGKNDAQGHGSSITYARRYALSSVMNIAADEDDDGNSASQGDNKQKTPYKPSTPSNTNQTNMITDAQIKAIGTKTKLIATKTEIEQAQVYKSAATHLKIDKSTRELTSSEASQVIKYLGTLE